MLVIARCVIEAALDAINAPSEASKATVRATPRLVPSRRPARWVSKPLSQRRESIRHFPPKFQSGSARSFACERRSPCHEWLRPEPYLFLPVRPKAHRKGAAQLDDPVALSVHQQQ